MKIIFFKKKIKRKKIKKVEHKPNIMANSVRTFGVGGMFVRLGNFKNKKLGYYKAYATNDTNAVLIELKNDKDVVISPEQPENFVEEVKNRLLKN